MHEQHSGTCALPIRAIEDPVNLQLVFRSNLVAFKTSWNMVISVVSNINLAFAKKVILLSQRWDVSSLKISSQMQPFVAENQYISQLFLVAQRANDFELRLNLVSV
ncbi:Hypothetical_protein [Hexamita inflata]|uniref:Hypothetical_protein n=1 Tax=Hexamita inflata TaxID=28002 RepID=A0AA86Q4G7_9EUKA|nr:Hypothetical protein HINF_LOCUS39576 [Hexamita inflata]